MLWFYVLISVIGLAILGIQVYWITMVRKTQELYVKEMQSQAPTMFDIRELLIDGDKDMAVRLYCEIFNMENIELARKEIEELERSIHFN